MISSPSVSSPVGSGTPFGPPLSQIVSTDVPVPLPLGDLLDAVPEGPGSGASGTTERVVRSRVRLTLLGLLMLRLFEVIRTTIGDKKGNIFHVN